VGEVTVLDPLGGLGALALVGILALYFLKARRQPQLVPSTLWWRQLVADRQASAPWQRLRPSWLLALQLAGAALLTGALLQPAVVSAEALSGQTIVIIDNSETMQATDLHPSRFAVAVADARSLVNRLAADARMTLIAMSSSPAVIAESEGDRAPLLAALSQLRPTDGPADLQAALQLAVAAAGPRPTGTRLIVYSDGLTEPLPEAVNLPFPVQYHEIGISGESVGVTSLSVLPGLTGEVATAHIQNFGLLSAHLVVEMAADGRLRAAKALLLGPGSGSDVGFAVPPGTSYVRVSVSPPGELAPGSSAVAVAAPPRKLHVLLVTPGDIFLQRALALRPDVVVRTEAPSQWSAPQARDQEVDLFVFEGFVPPELPSSAPYLLVGPPPDPALGIGGAVAPGPLVPAQANNPLLSDVDVTGVEAAATADLSGARLGQPVLTSAAGPVLIVRPATSSSPAAAVLGLYLHDSDLVLRDAFPVLVSHLSEYLAPDTVPPAAVTPGEEVTLAPGPGTTRVTVTLPDGSRDELSMRGVGAAGGTLLFASTSEPGIYKVSASGPAREQTVGYLAVNAPGAATAPQASIDVAGNGAPGPPLSRSYRDLWPWFALAALLVLLAEWAFYHRGAGALVKGT
jgi:Ca-activated chloride channel family protein